MSIQPHEFDEFSIALILGVLIRVLEEQGLIKEEIDDNGNVRIAGTFNVAVVGNECLSLLADLGDGIIVPEGKPN